MVEDGYCFWKVAMKFKTDVVLVQRLVARDWPGGVPEVANWRLGETRVTGTGQERLFPARLKQRESLLASRRRDRPIE